MTVLLCGVSQAGELASSVRGPFSGKKILWVDSYHSDYEWSASIEKGLRLALYESGVELKIFHMDTKRHLDEDFHRQAGRRAKQIIEEYRPDLVIASDDNAQKHLVVPYLRGRNLPVVFCGVNRDPVEYGYPCQNVTGMREVNFADALTGAMRDFAGGERIGMLAGNTETMRIVNDHYRQVFGDRLTVYTVRTWAEFKEAFLQAQHEVDILCLRNNAAIQDWEAAAAEIFLAEQTRIPTGSINPWMKKFVIFNLASFPEEQGSFAATAALRILAGTRPEEIPVTQNRRAHLTVNLKMAQAAGVLLPVSLLETAEVIGQEALQK